MTLKPWREIATPHRDVLEGTFKQAEFAADLSQVATGIAPPEYRDPEQFFARTFITEGMRLLLISVVQRLTGVGGDPVIQLQTPFGGGKTHTLLAVYHLASQKVGASRLAGIPPLLDEAKISMLPTARVAVIDGLRLSASQPALYGSTTVNTVWGELAWQLLGDTGYQKVAGSDVAGTSPGKEVLIDLLQSAAPCVILMDELVAFIRQLEPSKTYLAGTFESNMSFVQALTEAVKSVPNAVLLASLPESDLEAGGALGQRALDTLEKYFGRLESVWKPVAPVEAFEIVRRRLFDTTGPAHERDAVCRAFTEWYQHHPNQFPQDVQTADYLDRLRQSYPIHPEVFDRLYEDWSTLEKFQRTRGVLQYMAIVIHRLWTSDNRDALILPGSIPLEDSNVRTKSIHYLPQGWEPVIEREIDGPRSEPLAIDSRDTRFGSVQAARRVARTIFLGSAPSTAKQHVRGLPANRILLGSVQPGQTVGVFEDVLKRLRDRLHYLYSEQERFWFDTTPNLRREMESRKQTISDRDSLIPYLKRRLERAFGSQSLFAGIHVFTPSADVPDEYGAAPRLVVLPLDAVYSRTDATQAMAASEATLRNRGEQPRQKQNRLLFLAPDFDTVGRLKDQIRTLLAWQSIVADVEAERLILDTAQVRQAKEQVEQMEKVVGQTLREAYRWLMNPTEEFVRGQPKLRWDAVALSATAPGLTREIEQRLREEDWLVTEWSPIHLRDLLERWYFKEGIVDVGAAKVWRDTCHYLYLPRLANDGVFRKAVEAGLSSQEYFGFALGKDGDHYTGLVFNRPGNVILDDACVLVQRGAAREAQAAMDAARDEPAIPGQHAHGMEDKPLGPAQPDGPMPPPGTKPEPGLLPSGAPIKTRFYGTVKLDPIRATMDFATIVEEVVQHFSSQVGTTVTITVDIQAAAPKGFDPNMRRTVRENCAVLRFKNAEFED